MRTLLSVVATISVCAFLVGAKASISPDSISVDSNVAMETPIEEFHALQSQYFPMLDLRASPEQLAALPRFAARLSQVADRVHIDLARGTTSTPEQKADAGLVFIYDALMTHNNTHAALDGVLVLADLSAARRFSSTDHNDHNELVAREQYAQSQLHSALTLRPSDRRIDSWLTSVRATIERIETGTVSDASLGPVLDTIDARPTFNLWTALLMFQGRDASTDFFARLVNEAKDFVDGDDPCTSHPEDCRNGDHAPYNFQASVTVLGDAFLRRANHLMASGDIAGAMSLAHYAKGTYEQLSTPAHLPDTNSWPDRGVIVDRQDAVAKLLDAQTIDDAAFVASSDFHRPYECSSCHGRANSQATQ